MPFDTVADTVVGNRIFVPVLDGGGMSNFSNPGICRPGIRGWMGLGVRSRGGNFWVGGGEGRMERTGSCGTVEGEGSSLGRRDELETMGAAPPRLLGSLSDISGHGLRAESEFHQVLKLRVHF
jgi:hypothetical protein